jgi:transposase
MHIASIGIDLGKTTFHLVALGEQNKVLLRKKFSRLQLPARELALGVYAEMP